MAMCIFPNAQKSLHAAKSMKHSQTAYMIDSSGLDCSLGGKLLLAVALLLKSFYLFSRGSKITWFYRQEGTTVIPRKVFKTLCSFSKAIFQKHIYCI